MKFNGFFVSRLTLFARRRHQEKLIAVQLSSFYCGSDYAAGHHA